MLDLEIRLPEEVLENMPSGKEEMVKYLAKYFDAVIDNYDNRFQKRVQGPMAGPLTRYEKAILKDFLIEMALGKMEEASQFSPEAVSAH